MMNEHKGESIFVTKPFFPPIDEFKKYIDEIWESSQLTNQGPLLKEFETRIKELLGVTDFQFVANGTLALQLAIKGLNIPKGEIITTPFSYVATVSSILWENHTPVFVDIDPDTFCLDPNGIEAAITAKTRAIIPVHVFGNACDIKTIATIASKYNIKVIYDGAHAFGVNYLGKSLLDYGDISTCSFHATKLFSTVEGGGVFCADQKVSKYIDLLKRFGHEGEHHLQLGINAKANEFNAAFGLAGIPYIDEIIAKRKQISELYFNNLDGISYIRFQKLLVDEYNYSYFPLVFDQVITKDKVIQSLQERDIYPRRYFYPSLNKLPYLKEHQQCPVSEELASRILCLPLYADLGEAVVDKICDVIRYA